MIEIAIGFLVAVAVGLTSMGGGSLTTPAIVLFAGLPTSAAVGTSLVFSAVLRMLAAPFYVLRREINFCYLRRMSMGAVPGLLGGTLLLRGLATEKWSPVVLIAIGLTLVGSSCLSFVPRLRQKRFLHADSRWLSWLALVIGVETGFSSAGAGALGTVLLLNYSELRVAEVVGTDIAFGSVLAVIGAAFHLSWGSVTTEVLVRLICGGVPGVLVGCMIGRKLPTARLRFAVAVLAIILGMQLAWTGARGWLVQP